MAPLHPIRTTDSMARLEYPHLHYRLDGPMDRTHLHYRLDGPMTSFALPARWPDCIPSGLPHSRLDGPTASHPHYRLDGPMTSFALPPRWPDCIPAGLPTAFPARWPYCFPSALPARWPDDFVRSTGSVPRLHPFRCTAPPARWPSIAGQPHHRLDGPITSSIASHTFPARWP